MTKPLASDLLESKIRVATISPGMFNSPLTNSLPQQTISAISRCHTIAPKRFGESNEFAHLVMYCVQNKSLNGTIIELDAGIDIDFI